MNIKSLLHMVVVIGAAITSATPAFAEQKLLAGQSEIAFINKEMGVPIEGHFKKFDAQIMFDATRPETSKIDFNVDLSSATIGSPETDAELVKAAWFNAAQFPTARFRSSAVRQLDVGKYQVDGTLSIKGVMRNITVPVSVTQTGANTIASGVFLMKRLDYKIGDNEWGNTSIVADEVQVKFKLMLTSMNNR